MRARAPRLVIRSDDDDYVISTGFRQSFFFLLILAENVIAYHDRRSFTPAQSVRNTSLNAVYALDRTRRDIARI